MWPMVPLSGVSLSLLICSRIAMVFQVLTCPVRIKCIIKVICTQGNMDIIRKSSVNFFDKKPRKEIKSPAPQNGIIQILSPLWIPLKQNSSVHSFISIWLPETKSPCDWMWVIPDGGAREGGAGGGEQKGQRGGCSGRAADFGARDEGGEEKETATWHFQLQQTFLKLKAKF